MESLCTERAPVRRYRQKIPPVALRMTFAAPESPGAISGGEAAGRPTEATGDACRGEDPATRCLVQTGPS